MNSKEFLQRIEEGYNKRRNNNIKDISMLSLKKVIEAYYTYVEKPEFSILVEEYKANYIYNESRVERNMTPEEQMGLGEIYDYISKFDFSRDNFNIFITSMIIHHKLYSKCPESSYGGKLRDSNVYLFDTNIEVVDYIAVVVAEVEVFDYFALFVDLVIVTFVVELVDFVYYSYFFLFHLFHHLNQLILVLH